MGEQEKEIAPHNKPSIEFSGSSGSEAGDSATPVELSDSRKM